MDDKPVFPTFDIEGRQFSKLLLGHNPFLGGSYMSQARTRLYKETFCDPKAIERVIVRSIEMGVRGMMASIQKDFTSRLKQALHGAAEKTGVLLPTIMIVSPGFEANLADYRELNCQAMVIHGQVTDAMYIKSKGTMSGDFADMLKKIRDAGIVPGMSTHNAGETIPAAETFDAAFINTPINKIMWRMCPCEEMVLGAIRKTAKKVIAMKPLAMGRIAAQEGMEYVCRLPDVDGIVVGLGHEYEAEETFGIARTLLAAGRS
jgi:predicted aldo/keto reductase-like oxidoreductase